MPNIPKLKERQSGDRFVALAMSPRIKIPSHMLAIVDVRYFGDIFLDFEWAFKKLQKSIPEALKEDFGLGLN